MHEKNAEFPENCTEMMQNLRSNVRWHTYFHEKSRYIWLCRHLSFIFRLAERTFHGLEYTFHDVECTFQPMEYKTYSCEWIINCLFEENDFVYQETKDYFR